MISTYWNACNIYFAEKWNIYKMDVPEPTSPPISRYERIRKYIGDAKARNGELPVEPYLLSQIALILCDVLEEVGALRSEIAELNATNLELIVHRDVK